ncbi:twin-arginine translocase TatA/TatE family subunit [Pelagibacteraceae bacterium]|jgi:sec-independent protein translocase protein TatA|nr:twin-arginine translocase TatA/TatE family subunit [Pelagibacteraceae bacterium]|tara:strand:+ start:27 stop:215 length:189 start_codon:yes stop_codon:yes gene_type:complete
MGISFWQIIIVVALLVILFGRGKISELMGDVAKGVKSFKKGMSDDDNDKISSDNSDDSSQKD